MAKYTYAVMRENQVIENLETETKIAYAVATFRDQKFIKGEWQQVEPFIAAIAGAVNMANANELARSELAAHAGIRSEILEVVEV